MLDSPYRNLRVTREAIEELILSAARQHAPNKDRRIDDRIPMTAAVEAMPLTDAMNPTGMKVDMLTRDVSLSGVGLLTPLAITERYLLLKFPKLEVVTEVIWRDALGNGGFQRIGARFLLK